MKVLYKTMLVTGAANIIAPFRAGTLLTRPAILKKLFNLPLKKSYFATIIEQMLETIMEAIVFLVFVSLVSLSDVSFPYVTIIASAFSLVFLILLFYSRRGLSAAESLISLLARVMPRKLVGFAKKRKVAKSDIINILRDFQENGGKSRDIVLILSSSFAALLFSPLSMYFFFGFMSLDVTYFDAFFVFWASVFVGRVSGIPGGFGVREGSMIFMLTALGAPLLPSIQATILYRVLSTAIMLIMGFLASVDMGVPMFRKKAKAAAQPGGGAA